MKKKLGFAAVIAAAAVLSGALSSAYAADKVKVTYRVPFFLDVVKEIDAGEFPIEQYITDVRGQSVYGMEEGYKLIANNLSLTWYKDAARTEVYEFDAPADADLTLYGKLSESERYFVYNGFGWDIQSGVVYAGEPVDDHAVTNSQYVTNSYTDEETGEASFAFSGAEYAVYGRGLSVEKPFTVDFNFKNVTPEGNTAWFLFSLYPAVTLAQAGNTGPWARRRRSRTGRVSADTCPP